jgi:hypothetical protein
MTGEGADASDGAAERGGRGMRQRRIKGWCVGRVVALNQSHAQRMNCTIALSYRVTHPSLGMEVPRRRTWQVIPGHRIFSAGARSGGMPSPRHPGLADDCDGESRGLWRYFCDFMNATRARTSSGLADSS